MSQDPSVSGRACPFCGRQAREGARFCSRCGGAIGGEARPPEAELAPAASDRQATPPPSPPEGLAAPATAKPRPRAKRRVALLFWAGVLTLIGFLAVGVLLAGPLSAAVRSGRWELLPSMVASGGRLRPAPRPAGSSAPAVDVRPLPEVRLTAPRGALDRARQFRVTAGTPEEMAALARELNDPDAVPVAAYLVDGQMAPDEQFPGKLLLHFDLGKLGVRREYWPYVQAVHHQPGAAPQVLVTRIVDGAAVAGVRHNWFILLVVRLWQAFRAIPIKALGPVLIGASGAAFEAYERSERTEGIEWETDLTDHFLLHWPRSLRAADPGAAQDFKSLQGLLEKRRDRLLDLERQGLKDSSMYRNEGAAMMELFNLSLNKYTREYRRKHIWPPAVLQWAEALERAWEYLVTVRGFRSPGYVVNVYFRDPWPHGMAAAMTRNLSTQAPYIDLNPTETGGNEVHAQALHEFFHVVQKEYRGLTGYDAVSYGWFDEAAAPVLEEDAQHYYTQQRKFVTALPVTDGSFAAFQRVLNRPPEEAIPAHGYGASHFFRWLQDRYYNANRDRFLPTLYEDFTGVRGDTVGSLVRITSNSVATFNEDYRTFVAQHYQAIQDQTPPERNPPVLSMHARDPVWNWSAMSWEPLSAPTAYLLLTGIPANRAAEVRLVIQEEYPPEEEVITYWSTDGRRQTRVRDREAVVTPRVAGANVALSLQRVAPYRTQEAVRRGGEKTRIFALVPPDQPPTVQLAGKVLQVRWSPGPLEARDLVKEYRVRLRPPVGPPLTVRADRPEADINVAELRAWLAQHDPVRTVDVRKQTASAFRNLVKSATSNQDVRDLAEIQEHSLYLAYKKGDPSAKPWEVSYQVVARTRQEAVGPESPRAPVTLSEELNFDVTGDWVGRLIFTDLPVRMEIRSDASGFVGRSRTGEDRAKRIRGAWDPKLEVWTIKTEGVKEQDLPPALRALTSSRMRRFPGERLWVEFPPVLFHRPTEHER